VIDFRLRCVLTQQLFHVFQSLGMRPMSPNDISTLTIYDWMNEGFLKYNEFKRFLEGSKYTCSNIPIVLGIIAEMVRQGTITVDCDFKDLFEAGKGNLQVPFQRKFNDVRSGFPVLFSMTTPVVTKYPLRALVIWIINGGNPHNPIVPREEEIAKYLEFDEVLKEMTLASIVRLVWKGDSMPMPISEKKEQKSMKGFLPNDVYKRLLTKVEEATEKPSEKPGDEIIVILKEQESRFLNLAVNLRVHIDLMENFTEKPDPGAGAAAFDVSFADDSALPVQESTPAIFEHVANFKYLIESRKDGKKNIASNPFPKGLSDKGTCLVVSNTKNVKDLNLDYKTDLKTHWEKLFDDETDAIKQSSVDLQAKTVAENKAKKAGSDEEEDVSDTLERTRVPRKAATNTAEAELKQPSTKNKVQKKQGSSIGKTPIGHEEPAETPINASKGVRAETPDETNAGSDEESEGESGGPEEDEDEDDNQKSDDDESSEKEDVPLLGLIGDAGVPPSDHETVDACKILNDPMLATPDQIKKKPRAMFDKSSGKKATTSQAAPASPPRTNSISSQPDAPKSPTLRSATRKREYPVRVNLANNTEERASKKPKTKTKKATKTK
jgi:hypothetical protein